MGEGNFPKMFLGLFKSKRVYVCYDCDEAGRKAARKVAFELTEAGAEVLLVDLGLEGTKDDKDITDFFIKHQRTGEQLQEKIDSAIPFDGEMFQEEKNVHYPLVDLWNVTHGEYKGKRLSSRVIMQGRFSSDMEAPSAIEWECNKPVLDDDGVSTAGNVLSKRNQAGGR